MPDEITARRIVDVVLGELFQLEPIRHAWENMNDNARDNMIQGLRVAVMEMPDD